MTKNLWERERSNVFKYLVKQYLEEGYDIREAKSLAKIEVDEVMSDKEGFVKTLWGEQYRDV
tara:strand:- start:405 stop:590 length:186 start_codon:yes stop_codon:yes gene_type:complete